MISITVRPKTDGYTRKELKAEFNKYSRSNADLDEFIAAVMRDGQLEKRGDVYFPTYVQTTDEQIVEPEYRVYEAGSYGSVQKTKKGEYQPIAIAGLIGDTRADPTDMRLVSYQDENGKWQPIEEKTMLIGDGKTPAKPRKNYERWRANIPADIVRNPNYNLKPGTRIKVRVGRIIPRYFGTLSFWGYKITLMISFVSTSTKNEKARKIELKASDFNVEVHNSIRTELDAAGKKLERVAEKWLRIHDAGYHNFLYNEKYCTSTVDIPTTGEDFSVLTAPPDSMVATITLKDYDRGKEITIGQNTLKRNWVDDEDKTVAGFFLGTHLKKDIIAHNYKGRNRTYIVNAGSDNEKIHTVNSYKQKLKQQRLNFSNQPFKRKKQ